MAFLGPVAGVISAAASVVSGVMGFMQANQQAKIAQMNAQIADDNAKRALQVSQVEQQDQDAMTLGMVGRQLAQQSASGLSIGGGSQLLARKSARELGRRDALNVRQAGEIDAYNQRVQGANFRAEASAAKMSGFSSLVGGFLGGASSLAGQAQGMKRPTSFGDPWAGMRIVR